MKNIPTLLLDLDGVQADFFGAWASYHGVKSYKDIPDAEKQFEQFRISSAEQVYKFFRNLKPLPGGQKLYNWVLNNEIPFRICSAPLSGPYRDASIKAKVGWLDEHRSGTSSSAIFTGKKFEHAVDSEGNQRVLVDDFGPYIEKFQDAGGITVHYKDSEIDDAIAQLEIIYAPYM
jgi:hypothetical protein